MAHDIYIEGTRRGEATTFKIASRNAKDAAVRYAEQYAEEVKRPIYERIKTDRLYVVNADTGEIVWDQRGQE